MCDCTASLPPTSPFKSNEAIGDNTGVSGAISESSEEPLVPLICCRRTDYHQAHGEGLDVDHDGPNHDVARDPAQQGELPSEDVQAPDINQENERPSQSELPAPLDNGTDTFRFAHDFVIHNQTIISQIINSGDMGLKILWEKRMIGAEVDSDARKYPPRCHPETRRSLRRDIIEWMTAERDHDLLRERHKQTPRMLWVMGHAGVGKSAIAQTIAEEAKGEGRLGASLFFSRPNRRDDPQQVIPTIAYQLAVKYPKYKLILNNKLASDPSLLEKTIRVQFKELILDPFSIIMIRDSSTTYKPFLVILDGLDECKSEEAQCEFIELINENASSAQGFLLLWMICSRPEWHFRGLLSRPDFPATCVRKHMSVDDPEARQDVALYLRDEFATINRQFSDYLPPSWPPEKAIRTIVTKASGLFALATTVARFIADTEASDPDGQLQICLNALDGLEASGPRHPLATLDLLYREICSRITSDLLTTKLILGVCALYSDSIVLEALSLATFLGLSQARFYRALERLHSVLEIPRGDKARNNPIRFYHASFQDYLRDPTRSIEYTVNEEAVHRNIAMKALEWNVHPSRRELRWATINNHGEGDSLALVGSLDKFSTPSGWKACSRVVGVEARRSLVAMLNKFNFRNLEIDLDSFLEFLRWLHSMDPGTQSILHVRTQDCPPCHSDHQLEITGQSDVLEEFRRLFLGRLGRSDDFPVRLHIGIGENMCEISLLYEGEEWVLQARERIERGERERHEMEERERGEMKRRVKERVRRGWEQQVRERVEKEWVRQERERMEKEQKEQCEKEEREREERKREEKERAREEWEQQVRERVRNEWEEAQRQRVRNGTGF